MNKNNICLFHDTPQQHVINPFCIKEGVVIKDGNTTHSKGYTICPCGGRFSRFKAYKMERRKIKIF